MHKQTNNCSSKKVSFERKEIRERKKEKSGCRMTKISFREFSALDTHTTHTHIIRINYER